MGELYGMKLFLDKNIKKLYKIKKTKKPKKHRYNVI